MSTVYAHFMTGGEVWQGGVIVAERVCLVCRVASDACATIALSAGSAGIITCSVGIRSLPMSTGIQLTAQSINRPDGTGLKG